MDKRHKDVVAWLASRPLGFWMNWHDGPIRKHGTFIGQDAQGWFMTAHVGQLVNNPPPRAYCASISLEHVVYYLLYDEEYGWPDSTSEDPGAIAPTATEVVSPG